MRKIKLGVLITLIGLIGMIFGLASESLPFLAKTILFIISTMIMILGVLIETPVLEHFKSYPDEDISFTRNTPPELQNYQK